MKWDNNIYLNRRGKEVFAVMLPARVIRLNKNEKWAEKLSEQCGLSAAFLNDVLKELGESCFGDASTAKQVLEELTLSCHMDREELMKFMEEVSKNCPADAEKLKEAVLKANGDKEKLWKELSLWTQWIYRDSNR